MAGEPSKISGLPEALTIDSNTEFPVAKAGVTNRVKLSTILTYLNSNVVPVASVNGRTGAITIISADVTGGLGYTPLNKAGDTVSGDLFIGNSNHKVNYTGVTGASHFTNNLAITSFWGVGLTTSITSPQQTIAPGFYSHTFNTRTGAASIYGSLVTGGTFYANTARIYTSGTSIVLAAGGRVATLSSSTPVAGGTGAVLNERFRDASGNLYTATAVSTGVVTSVALNGAFPINTAEPSNPVSLTSITGSASGVTVNLTWTQSVDLTLNPSGNTTVSGTLTTVGALNAASMSVTGAATFSSNVSVTGTGTFTSNVVAASSASAPITLSSGTISVPASQSINMRVATAGQTLAFGAPGAGLGYGLIVTPNTDGNAIFGAAPNDVQVVNRLSFGMIRNTSPTYNMSGTVTPTAFSGNGTTATVTFAAISGVVIPVGSTITISGATPSGYNATDAVVTASTATSVSYANATTGALSVAGTLAYKMATPRIFNLTTNWTGTAASTQFHVPYSFAVASDTADTLYTGAGAVTLLIARNWGGAAKGARTGLRISMSQVSATNDPIIAGLPNQQHVAAELWGFANYNAGGTGTYADAAGSFYGTNPQIRLQYGATYWRLANALGEVNLAVNASTRDVTIGGTAKAGDVLSITFTSADIAGGAVTVSWTVGTSQTLTMIANNLCAAIIANTTLADARISASVTGAVISIYYYTHIASLAVTTSKSGGSTETLTVGSVTTGASVDLKVMGSFIRLRDDTAPATLNSAFVILASQAGSGTAGLFNYGFILGALDGYNAEWSWHRNSTLIGAGISVAYGGSNQTAPLIPNYARYGIDWRNVNFTAGSGAAFTSPRFTVLGTGNLLLSNTTITATNAGLAIDIAGKVASSVAVSSGGGGGGGSNVSNYFIGDLVFDDYGGQYRVSNVNAVTGAVSALVVLVAPAYNDVAPSNPISTRGGSGSGLTLNVTWPASGNTLTLQGSAGSTSIGGTVIAASTQTAPITISSGMIQVGSGQALNIRVASADQNINFGQAGLGNTMTVTPTTGGNPGVGDPLVGTYGNIVTITNRLKAGYYTNFGATFDLDDPLNTNPITPPAATKPIKPPQILYLVSNFTGNTQQNDLMPYHLSIASDTVDIRNSPNSITVLKVSHNFGGTGTYGARGTIRATLSTVANYSDTATNQQHTVGEFWFTGAHNTGGTGTDTSARGYAYALNPQVLLKPGATNWRLANALGEVDLAVYGTTQTLTLGGTPQTADVLTVTFTGASVPNTPVSVSWTVGASQTLVTIANNLEAAINNNADLRSANIAAIARDGIITLTWARNAALVVTTSKSLGATETLTLGSVVAGASVDIKLMASFARLKYDSAPPALAGNSAMIAFLAQADAPQSGSFSYGIAYGGLPNYNAAWPFRFDATLIGASTQTVNGAENRNARFIPNYAAYGVDWRNVNFSGASFISSNFKVDGAGGVTIGNTYLNNTNAGFTLNIQGKTATSVAVSNGGGGGAGSLLNNYFVGDVVFDAFGGQYKVTAVNASTGAVTAISVLSAPSYIGSAPSNPVATTGGSGSSLTLNITWPAGGTTLAIQASGGATTMGGALTVSGVVDVASLTMNGLVFASSPGGYSYGINIVGSGAGIGISNSAIESTIFGHRAGGSEGAGMTGAENTLIGWCAGANMTTGHFNTAVGVGGMWHEDTGSFNVSVGADAMRNTVGVNYCIAMGMNAIRNGNATNASIGIGQDALRGQDGNTNTVGQNNIAIGFGVMKGEFTLTTAANNVLIGNTAAQNNVTTASNNVGVGHQVLVALSSGADNVALGVLALTSITTGGGNIAIGRNAGDILTTGLNNIVIGKDAGGVTLQTGSNNILIGNSNADTAASSTSGSLVIAMSSVPVISATGINGSSPVVTIPTLTVTNGITATAATINNNSAGGGGTATLGGMILNDTAVGSTWDLVNPHVGIVFSTSDASGAGAGGRALIGTVAEDIFLAKSKLSFYTVPTTAGTYVERMSISSTGVVTIGGALIAGTFTPSSSTVPTNGAYLPAANTLGWAASSTQIMTATSTVISIKPTTVASSTTTGALTVAGGVGIAGAVYVGGAVQIGASGNTVAITHNATSGTAATIVFGGTGGAVISTNTANILRLVNPASTVNYWSISGSVVNGMLSLGADSGSSDSNVSILFAPKGTGGISIGATDTPGEMLVVNGNIVSSGMAWKSRAITTVSTWESVAFGNDRFVAVASADGGAGASERVMWSLDGINWQLATAASTNQWNRVAYGRPSGSGLFVAVSVTGTANRVMTSPDGITWTTRSTTGLDSTWRAICWGPGLFVATASSGSNLVMTSPDGVTWTGRTASVANQWFGVTWGNGLFVAVAASGTGDRIMTSPDGTTWTTRTSPEDNAWRSVRYANGLFVAVASSGTNRCMTSPDGITWTARSMPAGNWYSVTYGDGLWVAISNGSTYRIATSVDGINWVGRSSPEANTFQALAYGNGMFVAASQDGTNRVITSGKQISSNYN